MQGTPVGKLGNEKGDLGTPSAPPIVGLGSVCESEAGSQKSISEECRESVKNETETVQRYDDKDANAVLFYL